MKKTQQGCVHLKHTLLLSVKNISKKFFAFFYFLLGDGKEKYFLLYWRKEWEEKKNEEENDENGYHHFSLMAVLLTWIEFTIFFFLKRWKTKKGLAFNELFNLRKIFLTNKLI